MGFNFPDAPTLGQVFPPYQWDGEKWFLQKKPGTGYAMVYVGDTAPTVDVIDNMFWWCSATGVLYFRYNDGSSAQWVIASPMPPQGPQGVAGPQGPQGIPGPWTQITQAAYNALSPPNPATLYVVIG